MFKLTVAELSVSLRRKEFSSVELTQAFLDRISKYKALNAFITLDPENRSRRRAPPMNVS